MSPLAKLINIYRKVDQNLLAEKRKKLKGFKAKMDLARTPSEKFADFLTDSFGTVWFFSFNALLFVVWLSMNSGLVPAVPIFDPYPFGMLTMIVSLEAIFLAIIVLISQNRAAKIADIREETDLQVNTLAEKEITRMIKMLDDIHDHLGFPSEDDEELKQMKLGTNLDEIEDALIKEQREEE